MNRKLWLPSEKLWVPSEGRVCRDLSHLRPRERGAIGIMAQRMPLKPIGSGANPPSPGTAVLRLALRGDKGTWQDSGGTTPATASTDPLALWQDQSGNGNHMTQSGSLRPTISATQLDSLNTVNFNGSTQYMAMAAAYHFANGADGAATIYAVVSDHAAQYGDIIAGGGGDWLIYRLTNTKKQDLVGEGSFDVGQGSTVLTLDTFYQMNASVVSTIPGPWVFRIASAADANGTFGSGLWDANTMKFQLIGGGTSAGNEHYLSGNLAGLFVYDGLHSLSDKQTVEAWITSVWASV